MYQAPAVETNHKHPEHVHPRALGPKETPGYHQADSVRPAVPTQRQQEAEIAPALAGDSAGRRH